MNDFSFEGPYGYENWRACNAGLEKSGEGGEAFVYSDSRFSGELVTELGPYQLVNAISMSPVGTLAPVFALRLEDYIPTQAAQELPIKLLSQGETSLARYHGGSTYDEVTALMSLVHGVRLQAGPITRMFGRGADPRGRPMMPDAAPPILLPHRGPPVLPRIARDVAITASQLPSYPLLSPADALALARAARSYQEAVWVAGSDPQLAWLLLVSAVETAAVRWFSAANAPSGTDSELLRAGKPELADLLEELGGPELLAAVAVHIAASMRAGHKFRMFLTAFVPEPPEPRPNDWAAVDWSPKGLKKVLNKVYGHRSKALHESIPFPLPMCGAPMSFDNGDGTKWVAETPGGGAMFAQGGVWRTADTPIMLWTFEHLVRGALLNWWASISRPERDGSA